MDQTVTLALLRHALQVAAGALIARGVMDEGTAEAAVGGVLSLFTVAWYFVAKRK